jgi:SpoVK/Ycf46/Vps4 family AAA+-type ATPase
MLVVSSLTLYVLSVRIMREFTKSDPTVDEARLKRVKATFRLSAAGSWSPLHDQVLGTVLLPDETRVRLDDVIGLDDTKRLLRQLVVHCETSGARRLNGVILHGPPGTGKTMLAKAVATELRRPFLALSPSDLEDKYFGESGKRVRAFFEVAHALAPCVVFMDELDGICGARCALDQSHVNTLKTMLLTSMDGVDTAASRIMYMGATNRLDSVDAAMKRRMRLHIDVPLPDTDVRRQMLVKTLPAESLTDAVLKRTQGLSGSDLDQLVALAEFEASSHSGPVSTDDVDRAITRLKPA